MCSHYSYIAIDLKSFYASVECQERGLDPLTTNLVVADVSRTEKTICLAVSPSLKAYGIGGRARLFEVVQRVREVNATRNRCLGTKYASRRSNKTPPYKDLPLENDHTGCMLEAYQPVRASRFARPSFHDVEVQSHPEIELDFLIAKPRMAKYLELSTRIYEVYLKYFAPEDVHVYSIDEVMIDISKYNTTYKLDASELASRVITDIFDTTGITATAGIGTNLYLAKVAMDILAKHEKPDENGVRIAKLDEHTYRRRLWAHQPLTDFWRVGRGYANKLEENGMFTMGDVARCSLGAKNVRRNEDLLFKLFGKNAELLIDHAWGYEPVTMQEIKAYKPSTNCKTSGQVLHNPYPADKARLVVWEMADQMALDLLAEGLETDKLTLTVSYDKSSLNNPDAMEMYTGEITVDFYGRSVPKHAHGTINLDDYTSSSHVLTHTATELFDRIINPELLARKITLTAERVISKTEAQYARTHGQMSFDDLLSGDVSTQCDKGVSGVSTAAMSETDDDFDVERERQLQEVMLDVRSKFGKNAVLRASSLQEGACARQRNNQIGGHSA